ncbi:MAG: alpha/beta hydrolase [Anaerolineae bacterium]
MTETIMKGAEPFFFTGNSTGCLLLHGFSGTPHEMRELGEYLAERGLTVCSVRLAGHGTRLSDLARTGWSDWYRSAREGLLKLEERCNQVFAIGLSLGAALSLCLAAHHHLAGVVAMATPVFSFTNPAHWRRAIRGLLRYLVVGPPPILRNPAALADHLSYQHVPQRCALPLAFSMHQLDVNLHRVEVPTLLIHSRLDAVVSPESMLYIYQQIGSVEKEMVWLENSGHVIPEDYEKERVFQLVYQFVKNRSSCACLFR